MRDSTTPCGATTSHAPHTFVSQRGKKIVCDGVPRDKKDA